MGNMSFFEQFVGRKLENLHCGYIGKVISTNGKTAKVQPLGLYQPTDNTGAKTRAVVADVPVACRYKITAKTITYVIDAKGSTRSQTIAVPQEIAAGDLVACLCADWNITAARSGKNELPPAGRHSISDSIIVGIL